MLQHLLDHRLPVCILCLWSDMHGDWGWCTYRRDTSPSCGHPLWLWREVSAIFRRGGRNEGSAPIRIQKWTNMQHIEQADKNFRAACDACNIVSFMNGWISTVMCVTIMEWACYLLIWGTSCVDVVTPQGMYCLNHWSHKFNNHTHLTSYISIL